MKTISSILSIFILNFVKDYRVQAFITTFSTPQQKTVLFSSTSSSTNNNSQQTSLPSTDWELDCYSRPVVLEGNKKLWEVLITDSTGTLRVCQSIPSNRVNSRELRKVIEGVIEESEVKPTTIRFFRGSMFNMITIALSEINDVSVIPSRCTTSLLKWIEERNENVYPKMEGYRAIMTNADSANFIDIRTPIKLPDALRGERYAFVSLPLAEFLPGGGITQENIGIGRLFSINPAELSSIASGDSFIQGLVIMSSRAKALASWINGVELYGVTADVRKRVLMLETDINTQYLMARLNDEQRQEGAIFEQGKKEMNGLHFVCVQKDEDDEEPAGFWLLREMSTVI